MIEPWQEIDWREVKRLVTTPEVSGAVLGLLTAMRVNVEIGTAELPFIADLARLVADKEHAAAAIFFAMSMLMPALETLEEQGVDTARWVQRMALKYAR